MAPESKTMRKVRSKYTDEFKAGAVRLVAEGRTPTDEKSELAEDFESAADVKRQAFDCIEVFYNQQRMHSALGDQSPAE